MGCKQSTENADRVPKTKFNKKIHRKFGWRGGILVEKGPQGVEGHFQTAFTVDKDEEYEKVPEKEMTQDSNTILSIEDSRSQSFYSLDKKSTTQTN